MIKIENILSQKMILKLQKAIGGQRIYIPKSKRMSNNIIKARYNILIKKSNLKKSAVMKIICEEFDLTLRNAYLIIKETP